MKKKLIVVIVLGLIVGAAPAVPADAAPGGFEFMCSTDLPEWPAIGQTALPCVGNAYGASTSNLCPLGCHFQMTINEYSANCTANEPPMVGQASGSIYIDFAHVGDYDWVRIGTSITFFRSGTNVVMGHGTWIPSVPLGTCAAPARPFHLTITGSIGTP